VRNFFIFSWVNTYPFDLKFVAFYPKFSGDSYVEFQEKKYFGRIFQKFCDNQDDTKTCEIWTHFLQFYSGSVLRRKNSHKYLPMLFTPR